MLFNTRSLGLMRGSLQGLSLQQEVILHNLANVDTPIYNAKYASFEDVLRGTEAGTKGAYDLKAHILTDEATEMRPDEIGRAHV